MSERDQLEIGSGETPELTCPHCHKSFVTRALPATARHRGYKCPHCRLFVPLERAGDTPLGRDANT